MQGGRAGGGRQLCAGLTSPERPAAAAQVPPPVLIQLLGCPRGR